jgi:hypothetical protein
MRAAYVLFTSLILSMAAPQVFGGSIGRPRSDRERGDGWGSGSAFNVLRVLREHDIEVAVIHSHMLDEQPRLVFVHFWAVNDAEILAREPPRSPGDDAPRRNGLNWMGDSSESSSPEMPRG